MKKNYLVWITLLISVVAILSCNKKYDSLYNHAPGPAINFNRDTFFFREKDRTNIKKEGAARLVVYCNSVDHSLNLQLAEATGKVHLLYRGSEILPSQFLPAMDSLELFMYCDTAGRYAVDCLLTDRLGKVGQKQFFVQCLPNQKPIASFFSVLQDQSQLQNWGYLFDASISSDPDGMITGYHFLVNGQHFFTNQPTFPWNFHAKGTHELALYVTDDLGLNSDTLHQKLSIQ